MFRPVRMTGLAGQPPDRQPPTRERERIRMHRSRIETAVVNTDAPGRDAVPEKTPERTTRRACPEEVYDD